MSDRVSVGTASVVVALVVDAVLVVVFAVVGRSSHAEGLDVAGIRGTAWPFLAGLGVGWLAARAWRHPLALWPTGVIVWASTLVVGMLLRRVTGLRRAVGVWVVDPRTLGVRLGGGGAIARAVIRLRARVGVGAA